MTGAGHPELAEAVGRLEEVAAALAAGGDDHEEMERLAREAVAVSEAITRLLPAALEGDDGGS